MAKIKHSKYKNSAFLFELLVRQITSDILADRTSLAKSILKDSFNIKAELGKEYKLYNLLLSEKYKTEYRADKFIDTIIDSRKKLNENKLKREKYNLIKEIKENFDIGVFFNYPVLKYKEMASVYALFESYCNDKFMPADSFRYRTTIVENMLLDSKSLLTIDDSKLLETYKKESKDLRILSYNILVNKFNEKYKDLNDKQKNILKEYIQNLTDNKKLKSFIVKESKNIIKSIEHLKETVGDNITNIKLSETINQLKRLEKKPENKIKENHITAVLIAHELVKELQSKAGESK